MSAENRQSESSALAEFRWAAIAWAGGESAVDLSRAAAEAMAAGIESPSLARLAGAPSATAADEAVSLAPTVFEELGLVIAPRLSPEAQVAYAGLLARRFLQTRRGPRAFTRRLYRLWVQTGYPNALSDWSGLDDWYDLVELGHVPGSVAEIDRLVVEAAEVLANGGVLGVDPFG